MRDDRILIKRIIASDERDDVLEAEVEESTVLVHLSPRTDDVETFVLTSEGAWALARDLARCASAIEAGE